MMLQHETDAADGWSQRRVEVLRRHHAWGLSAGQSAELLGGISRNAVICKRNRLGLAGPRAAPALANVPLAPPYGRLGLAGCPEFRVEPLPEMDFPAPEGADPRRLCEKGEGRCAWPLGPADEAGDYRTRFCCAPAEPRRAYCAEHGRRARRNP